MFLQSATETAALPVRSTQDPCCQAVSQKPFPAPSCAPWGCHLFNLNIQTPIKNQDSYKCFDSWRDRPQILCTAFSSGMAIQTIFNKQWIYESTSTDVCIIWSFLFTDGMTSPLSSHTFLEEKWTTSAFKKCVNADDWFVNAVFRQRVFLLNLCVSL